MIKKLLCVLALWMSHSAFAAVDVNKSDKAALESVKGIGPSVSARLLEERKKSPFKDWPDLIERVKGVGEGTAARFSKEGLTVNGASFTPSATSGKADNKHRFAKAATTSRDDKK